MSSGNFHLRSVSVAVRPACECQSPRAHHVSSCLRTAALDGLGAVSFDEGLCVGQGLVRCLPLVPADAVREELAVGPVEGGGAGRSQPPCRASVDQC